MCGNTGKFNSSQAEKIACECVSIFSLTGIEKAVKMAHNSL